MEIRIIYLLICGLLAGFVPVSQADPVKYPDSYLTGGTNKFYETDDSTGDLVQYEIVPLSLQNKRDKRDTHPNVITLGQPEELSSLLKIDSSTKEPATSTNTSTVSSVSTISTVSSTSSSSSKDTDSLNATTISSVQKPLNMSWLNATQKPSIVAATATDKNLFGEPPTDDDGFNPWKYPSEDEIKEKNLTKTDEPEGNKYYNWKLIHTSKPGDESIYWVDLDKKNATKHEMLSSAHRRAATLKLPFKFPFYGHQINNVTLATGGFLYLGDQLHSWLAATQYIAPLMANFDSSINNKSVVRYALTDNELYVEWQNIHLQDVPDKPFTFQAQLYVNGTIVFAYKQIPIGINNINDTNHPVKVGLSEAYIQDKHLIFIKQKTIYEYDRVDLLKNQNDDIINGSAIIFTPYATCLNFVGCNSCVQSKTNFSCVWCSSVQRCSDGMDRYRQDWIVNECHKSQLNTTEACNRPTTSSETYHHEDFDINHRTYHHQDDLSPFNRNSESASVHKVKVSKDSNMSAGGVIGVLFLIMAIITIVGWVGYAWNYPHTPSGQFLIRYRPSQWSFGRGRNAQYTAASIHM